MVLSNHVVFTLLFEEDENYFFNLNLYLKFGFRIAAYRLIDNTVYRCYRAGRRYLRIFLRLQNPN